VPQFLLEHGHIWNIDISQGSVATHLRCGEIFKRELVANLPLSLPVKELWKSVNIRRSNGQEFSVLFFDSRCSRGTYRRISERSTVHRRRLRCRLLLDSVEGDLNWTCTRPDSVTYSTQTSCYSNGSDRSHRDRTNRSIVFATWRQCVRPYNTRFFVPTRVCIQTASRSVRPFLQGSRSWPTHRPRHFVCNDKPHLCYACDGAWKIRYTIYLMRSLSNATICLDDTCTGSWTCTCADSQVFPLTSVLYLAISVFHKSVKILAITSLELLDDIFTAHARKRYFCSGVGLMIHWQHAP